MSDANHPARSLRERLGGNTEERLGKALSELLENPLLTGAIGRAFDAREKAAQAQEVAMGALNLPSAADIERLTRRLRSVSQRLEGIEDGVDRLDRTLSPTGGDQADIAGRLSAIEGAADGADRQARSRGQALGWRAPGAKAAAKPTAGGAKPPSTRDAREGRRHCGAKRARAKRTGREQGKAQARLSAQADRAAIAARPMLSAAPSSGSSVDPLARARRASNVSETASTHATGTPRRAPIANSAAASISTASASAMAPALARVS